MNYSLDLLAERFIHSLCETIVLRERFILEPSSVEAAIFKDIIQDLSTGLALYFDLPQGGDEVPDSLQNFVKAISRCSGTEHVVSVFRNVSSLNAYLVPPYFSRADLRVLGDEP